VKEVQVLAWCDACRADDDEARVEGTTHKVRVDDVGLLELEMCERHDKELLEPLRRLLGEHGAPPAKAKASPSPPAPSADTRDARCPLVSCGARMQQRSLVNHVYQAHGGLGPNDPRPPGRPESVTALQWAVDFVERRAEGSA